MGIAQIAVGLWLLAGFAERVAVFIATAWMLILIALVAYGNPSMLADPYGALVKDVCLIACAVTVWTLAPNAIVAADASTKFARAKTSGPSR
jgi:DoxX-like family